MVLFQTTLHYFILDESVNIKVDMACSIALDIARGLSHIHDLGIVHFDVKPKNIMLNVRENNQIECAIGDFGVSTIEIFR